MSRTEANRGDRIFRWLSGGFAAASLLALGTMAIEMARASALSLRQFGLGFIASSEWDPVAERFGALPFLYGTVVSSLLALAIALPIALGTAILLSELAGPWTRRVVGFAVELLAAVPSVIYGLFGILALGPWLRVQVEPVLGRLGGWLPLFRGPHQGVGMLAGAILLAIMILPTISAISREVLAAVPGTLREGALALGASRWATIRRVVLPAAAPGIVGAVMLGLGRALGETMAVTMVIGNRPEISASLFAPAYTMASVIANEYAEATSDLHLAALSEIGLLLFLVTLAMSAMARLLVWRVGGRHAPAAARAGGG